MQDWGGFCSPSLFVQRGPVVLTVPLNHLCCKGHVSLMYLLTDDMYDLCHGPFVKIQFPVLIKVNSGGNSAF